MRYPGIFRFMKNIPCIGNEHVVQPRLAKSFSVWKPMMVENNGGNIPVYITNPIFPPYMKDIYPNIL